jgi:hypothetical protein
MRVHTERIVPTVLIALLLMPALGISANESSGFSPSAVRLQVATAPKPRPAPLRWRPLIGEYGRDSETVIILESDGKLCALFKRTELAPLKQLTSDSFEFDSSTARKGERVVFSRNRSKVTQVTIGTLTYQRKPVGPEEGANQLKIQPMRPVPILIKEALTAQPPNETGDFLPTDLVELRKLDPTIKLEIRLCALVVNSGQRATDCWSTMDTGPGT